MESMDIPLLPFPVEVAVGKYIVWDARTARSIRWLSSRRRSLRRFSCSMRTILHINDLSDKYVAAQKRVAELAAWIQVVQHLFEFIQPIVSPLQLLGFEREQLAPVRPRAKRRQLALDQRKDLSDF